MSKQSSDYLDRFSDKAGFNFESGSDFAVSVMHPAAGLGIRAAREAMHAQEIADLVDPKYFAGKRDQILYSNAAALSFGLFWVELGKNKQLSSGSLYVSPAALALLRDNVVPFNSKVQIDVSESALISDAPSPDNFYTVPNTASFKADQRSELVPIDGKLLQPEIKHKRITVYTDQRVAVPFVKYNLALVCLDDLIAFAGRKYAIIVNYGKGTVEYTGAALTMQKNKYAEYERMKAAAAAKLVPAADEWKCPSCGRIQKNFVGTCGCGEPKPR